MPDTCVCWKCGATLPELLLPLPRHEECPHCRTQLHVCRMCEFYAPEAPQQCREPVADPVADKQRANFCGYFRLNPQAYRAAPDRDAAARQALDALFGGGSAADDANDALNNELDALFKK